MKKEDRMQKPTKRFIEKIKNYLENNECGLEEVTSIEHKYFKLYRGCIKHKKEKLPIAIVGYPGGRTDIRDLATPKQTEMLTFVFEFWKKISNGNINAPLLVLGHSFDEVFLRKIRLLKKAIKDVRVVQYINVPDWAYFEKQLYTIKSNYESLKTKLRIENEEKDLQSAVVDYIKSGRELGGYAYNILGIEVPAGEGTKKSEVIDILAIEKKRRWLTVIELKFADLTHGRLKSSIFQALDYCNWVEDNKRGLAMLFPKFRINTRRRTRLILINGPHKFPAFHIDFIKSCKEKDRYQEIELYYTNNRIPITISPVIPQNIAIIKEDRLG